MSAIKDIRERLGLSQMEMAVKLGVHVSTIQYWEREGVPAKRYKEVLAITPEDMRDQLLQEVHDLRNTA